MKLINLINARKVLATYKDERMSTALAYKMMKIIKASDNDEAFYNDKFRELIGEYGLKDEQGNIVANGTQISLAPATAAECKKKIQELENTEVESPNVRLGIGELSELRMSMADVAALEEIIEEE